MELLANELSIHGQFFDISSFRDALGRLVAMRHMAKRFGREILSHRRLLAVSVSPGVKMQQALGRLAESERRAAMAWLTRHGPFWDDSRRHESGDWLECRGQIVTDTAVGEAGYRKMVAVECGLVSVAPSDWQVSPIEVTWRFGADGLDDRSASLENCWDPVDLENGLRQTVAPLLSWNALRRVWLPRFSGLGVCRVGRLGGSEDGEAREGRNPCPVIYRPALTR